MVKILIASVAITAILAPIVHPIEYDSTDDKASETRSGLKLYVDHETGCEYISSFFGSLTLRLDSNGKHICRKGGHGND